MRKALRLGLLIRVSTPGQLRDGESVNVQKKAMLRAVESLGHKAAHVFAGQEHATEGYERREFKRSVNLVERGELDGIMVADTSRFSRDGVEGKLAIRTLRDHKAHFFVLEREYDLWNPEHLLQLGILGEMNEHYAQQLLYKSRLSRIERARKGAPTAGGIPYGLRYDKVTGQWSIDKDEQKQLKRWVRMYVKEKRTWEQIQRIEGVDQNTLRRRVLDAGPLLVQNFKHNGEVVRVETPVPERLTPDEIEAVKGSSMLKRLRTHKKNPYTLAHLIHCNHCEGKSVLSGHAPKTRKGTVMRYYWHHLKTRGPTCFPGIRAEQLEADVIHQLWGLMKDNMTGLKASIKEALVSAREDFVELEDERKLMEARRTEIQRELRNQVGSLGSLGPTAAAMVNTRIEELVKELQAVEQREAEIGVELPHVEIPADLEQRVNAIMGRLIEKQGPHKLSETEKEALCQLFIGGPLHWRRKDSASRGIFIEKVTGKALQDEAKKLGIKNPEPYFRYTIKGALVLAKGTVDAAVEFDDLEREHAKLTGTPDAQSLVSIAEAAHLDVQRRGRRSSA